MWIYVKLAWRNLLRNKRRSLIAGTAIGIGLAALIFVDALVIGMERNMVEAATSTFLGEGEIQRKGFRSTQQADLTINQSAWIIDNLRQEQTLKHFAPRVMSYGVISSTADLCSIELVGIDPENEKDISEIDETIVKGSYFSGKDARDIVIGNKLAEILQVELGDRLVVTVSQAGTGMLAQDLFRVSGIFRLKIPEMDRSMVFIRLPKAQELLGIGENVHSIVLTFKNPKHGSDDTLPLWKKYSQYGNEAVGWPAIMPQLDAVFELSTFSIYLVGLILFGVVALGIINTLFMSLHERMFEFGVLRAVGTRPFGIAKLIVCEAGSLAIVSIVMGCILGFIVTLIVAGTGIDYTGIEYVGVTFRKLIYPVLRIRQFIEYPLWLFIFTLLVGLYPGDPCSKNVAGRSDAKELLNPMTLNKELISAKGVTKVYSDNGVPVHALHGVDLTIRRGEFTAIVGPSGSGKTTFLNIISGLDVPSEGEVWLNGKLLSGMSGRELSDFRRDNIGFIFQAYNLIPVLTVEENIEYVMLLQEVAKRERRRRVSSILRTIGMAGFEDRLPTQLSGGQQQRVAVARAMVSEPAIILADEPTANLDSSTSAALLGMMGALNQETGMTFVFSTHDGSVMERARRLILLKDGRIDSDTNRE